MKDKSHSLVMIIETILINNLGCFYGKKNALYESKGVEVELSIYLPLK